MATSDDDDRKLTAYLDGELDEAERAALEARLAADPALRARLDALRAAADRTRAAFAALLDRRRSPTCGRGSTRRLPPRRRAPRRPGAGASLRSPPRSRSSLSPPASAPDAGASGPATASPTRDDWRQAVVEYMALYTPESFGEAVSPQLGDELATLSRRLDAPLDVDRLKVDDLSPRRAELLQYDGAPLGQIGYLDGATPVAFCILRDGEADAPLASSSRDGFAVASWAQGGARLHADRQNSGRAADGARPFAEGEDGMTAALMRAAPPRRAAWCRLARPYLSPASPRRRPRRRRRGGARRLAHQPGAHAYRLCRRRDRLSAHPGRIPCLRRAAVDRLRPAAASRVAFTVPADSIEVGSSSFDDTLRGSNFLDAQRFPDIRFEIGPRVEKRDESTIDLTGDLTLLGVTRPLMVEVEVMRLGGARLAFVARAHIDRLAYGVNSGFPIISRDVELTVSSEALAG